MEEKDVIEEQARAGQAAEEQTSEEEAARRKLAEMNLLDDFLFGSMVAYPETGERQRVTSRGWLLRSVKR